MDHIVILLPAAFLLDALIGDPQELPHPVRLIGALISYLEGKLRRDGDERKKAYRKGAVFAFLVVFATAIVMALILILAHRIHPYVGLAVDLIFSVYVLAAKSLRDASMRVCKALEKGNISAARYAVSMIVGRDTDALDEAGIARAAVESVAESTSDGVIAPLFYLAVGGPGLAMVYKAINTMDSMVGYKNEKYRYFGTFAARLDDVVNYIPSRLSALAMIGASFFLRLDTKNAVRIFKRDRYQHASPNSAQTESVCAGALGLRLAGDAVYFGKTVSKPYIGDAKREIEPADIRRANRLMYGASILSILIFVLFRLFVAWLFMNL